MAGNASLSIHGGDLYIAAMTVINSVREVIQMPVSGISNSAQPILSFNYGADKNSRVKQTIRYMSVALLIYTVAAWILTMIFARQFILLFDSTPELLSLGAACMHIYFFGFFMMSFQFAGQSVFTALGRSKNAIFFSLLRKVIIVIPLIYLLPLTPLGVKGVFWAEPVSNFFGGAPALSLCILRFIRSCKYTAVLSCPQQSWHGFRVRCLGNNNLRPIRSFNSPTWEIIPTSGCSPITAVKHQSPVPVNFHPMSQTLHQ